VHVSLHISAGYLQTNFLQQTTYSILGRVSRGGVGELNHHVPGAVQVLCNTDQQYCTRRRRGSLMGVGWFKICSVTFTDSAAPGRGEILKSQRSIGNARHASAVHLTFARVGCMDGQGYI